FFNQKSEIEPMEIGRFRVACVPSLYRAISTIYKECRRLRTTRIRHGHDMVASVRAENLSGRYGQWHELADPKYLDFVLFLIVLRTDQKGAKGRAATPPRHTTGETQMDPGFGVAMVYAGATQHAFAILAQCLVDNGVLKPGQFSAAIRA